MSKLAGFLSIKRTFCSAAKAVIKESAAEKSYPRMSGERTLDIMNSMLTYLFSLI